MTSKRSAFTVFKEKSAKTFGNDEVPASKSDAKLKSIKHIESSSMHSDSNPSTPTVTKTTKKGEQRFSSLRKSIRKKSKKESHHDVSMKSGGKENKLHKAGSYLQVFERSNWTESLQSLNSSSLEAAFLPEVAKQKKEQKQLHEEQKHNLKSSSASDIVNKTDRPEKRKRTASCTVAVSENSQKPPIPKKSKKTTSPEKNKVTDSPEKGITPQAQKKAKKSHTASKTSLTSEALFSEEEKRISDAEKLFAWVIAPVKTDQFLVDVWQKKPLFIKRRQPQYNNVWFSCSEFDEILRQQNVQFTKNLDIAVYRNGKRETLNPDGRAFAPIVWNFYEEGCSIRLLNPQTFSKNIWHLSSRLQEYFGCFVGSNVYLTPPGSQGFAPHYDDIEAFIIQLEGKKHWKLYNSRNINEILPRYSSKNLSQEELGEPILDRVLEPGDTLYFPRGVIHQAVTPDDSHSLHITLSFCQKAGWSDFMEKLVPMALQTAIEEDVEFRKALPVGYHNHVGVSHSEKTSTDRKTFMKVAEQLMKKLVSYVSVDQAADEVVLDQMEEFLPPSLSVEESECTVLSSDALWDTNTCGVDEKPNLTLKTAVRIVRPGIVRLIAEDDSLQVHHTINNSRQYKETPPKIMELPLEFADAAEFLLLSYPKYVIIKDTPLLDDENKLELAMKLYNGGLLRTKEQLV